MSLWVKIRGAVDGAERDLFVEVRKLDVMLNDDGRPVALLDDYSILTAPEGLPVGLPPEEAEDLASVAEVANEEMIA